MNILKRWLSAFVANHTIVLTPQVSILQVRAHVFKSCTDEASPNQLSTVNAFFAFFYFIYVLVLTFLFIFPKFRNKNNIIAYKY